MTAFAYTFPLPPLAIEVSENLVTPCHLVTAEYGRGYPVRYFLAIPRGRVWLQLRASSQ